MATYRAIQETCEAIMNLLKLTYDAEQAPALPEEKPLPEQLTFDVHLAGDIKDHKMDTEGVSLFLYRVYVNANQRATQTRDATGKILRSPLPLELHFFLTIWAKSASIQHRILGWTMRVLEDYPVLPAALLNVSQTQVFDPDEDVELVCGQLTNEEMMRIWDDLQAPYQLSVPYMARVIRIQSRLGTDEGGQPVQTRAFELGTMEQAAKWTIPEPTP